MCTNLFSHFSHISSQKTHEKLSKHASYLSYVKNSDGHWYSLDEGNVKLVKECDVFQTNAYVLFYLSSPLHIDSKKNEKMESESERDGKEMSGEEIKVIGDNCPSFLAFLKEQKKFIGQSSSLILSFSSPLFSFSSSPSPLPSPSLSISSSLSPFYVIDLSEHPKCDRTPLHASHYFSVPVAKSNDNKRKLEAVFPSILRFAKSVLYPESCENDGENAHKSFVNEGKIGRNYLVIHSDDGPDVPVCVCIALLVKYYDKTTHSDFTLRTRERSAIEMNKKLIQTSFLGLLSHYPHARPPQVMMKMISRFFLSPAIYQR